YHLMLLLTVIDEVTPAPNSRREWAARSAARDAPPPSARPDHGPLDRPRRDAETRVWPDQRYSRPARSDCRQTLSATDVLRTAIGAERRLWHRQSSIKGRLPLRSTSAMGAMNSRSICLRFSSRCPMTGIQGTFGFETGIALNH